MDITYTLRMSKSSTKKSAIKPRFGKGRKITLLSYAVYSPSGAVEVSHATTAFLRKEGRDLLALMELEKARSGYQII